jgi:hypothetical protein
VTALLPLLPPLALLPYSFYRLCLLWFPHLLFSVLSVSPWFKIFSNQYPRAKCGLVAVMIRFVFPFTPNRKAATP